MDTNTPHLNDLQDRVGQYRCQRFFMSVAVLQSNNGEEYVSKTSCEGCGENAIVIWTTHCPNMNGAAQREYRTIAKILTPYEVWEGKRLPLDHFKAFAYRAF